MDEHTSETYVVDQSTESLADDEGQTFAEDENKERGNWSGRFDFILSCLGYAVGLGNVWRFPYLCYRNGGAVFFIPYVIALIFVGMPIFFLELSLGQFTSSGPTTCWKFAKMFKGIGWAMVIVSAAVAIYYNMIIAWACYYFVASFFDISKGDRLPWDWCNPEWASDFCETNLNSTIARSCVDLGYTVENGLCMNTTSGKVLGIVNSKVAKDAGFSLRSSAEDYLYSKVLKTGPQLATKDGPYVYGPGNMGELQWELIVALACAWVIVILSLIKGIKSSGKVVYFTALFPYVVLVILLVRGLLLEGSKDGIAFYIHNIQWDKLKDAEVWKDATVQIFFSLSASWGGLIALSSYNRFHNNCLRDSIIVSLGNCLTSFFAGFVIFSYIGYLALKLEVDIDSVAKGGVGLAFAIYPTAVSSIPAAPLWSILFFLMLITLGLDSEFALVETVVTAFLDEFPSLRKKKSLVYIFTGIVLFACGLPMCMNGGERLLTLMDDYSGGWNILIIAVLECVAVSYVYGFFRFSEDIQIMLGRRNFSALVWACFKYWWAICWAFFTPLSCLVLAGYTWYSYNKAVDKNISAYEENWYLLGWGFTLVMFGAIVLTALIMFFKQGTGAIKPTIDWGPALVKHRRLVTSYVPVFVVDPWGIPTDNGDAKQNIDHNIEDYSEPTKMPVQTFENEAYEPTKF